MRVTRDISLVDVNSTIQSNILTSSKTINQALQAASCYRAKRVEVRVLGFSVSFNLYTGSSWRTFKEAQMAVALPFRGKHCCDKVKIQQMLD